MLESQRRLLGENHPHTLTSLNNLGLLLQAQGKLDEAELLFRKALEDTRRTLGENYPGTLVTLGNLSRLLQKAGVNLKRPNPSFAGHWEGTRQAMGEGHPDTLLALSNLGSLLQKQGKLDAGRTSPSQGTGRYTPNTGRGTFTHTCISQ